MKLYSVFDHNSKFLTHIVAGSADAAFEELDNCIKVYFFDVEDE